jgi:hypothetical protein
MKKLLGHSVSCGALMVLLAVGANAQTPPSPDAKALECEKMCIRAEETCEMGLPPGERGKFSPKVKQCEGAQTSCVQACSKR